MTEKNYALYVLLQNTILAQSLIVEMLEQPESSMEELKDLYDGMGNLVSHFQLDSFAKYRKINRSTLPLSIETNTTLDLIKVNKPLKDTLTKSFLTSCNVTKKIGDLLKRFLNA